MPILNDDFPANASTTATLRIGASATGMFEEAPDSDWFAVQLVAGTSYVFGLRPDGVSGYFSGFSLAVVDASGRVLVAPVQGDNAADARAPSTSFQPTVSGTYYLAARETSYGALGYTVTAAVRTGADDFAASTASTGVIPAWGTASANFEVAGDHDWFKFYAYTGAMYQFTVQTQAGSDWAPASAPASTSIRDAAGNLVQTSGYRFETAVSGDFYLDTVGLHTGAYTMVSMLWADDYAADYSTVGVVAPGRSIDGGIQFDGDVDRIKVTLVGGKQYRIGVDGWGDNFDIDIGDANGTRLNYGGGFTGPGSGFGVVVAPTVSGDYYIDISHSQTTVLRSVLPYRIAVTAAAGDEIGDTPATAAALAVGSATSGVLETNADVDVFKVTLAAGVTYALTVPAGLASLKPVVTGADGLAVSLAAGADSGVTSFTPARGGVYYVALGPVAGALNLPYTLAIAQPADDAGANQVGARTLAIGGHADGVLEAGADRDWFAIALSAGSTVWFTLTSATYGSSGGQLRLFDANGAVLDATGVAAGLELAPTLAYRIATTATYYIEASSLQAKSGAYTIAAAIGVADDVGGTPASAAALTPDVAYAGTLELVSDIDMFKFAVVAGQTYGISLAASQYSTVAISDAQGVAMPTLARSGLGSDVLVTATASGTLYASVHSAFQGAAATTYTIKEAVYGRDDFAGDTSSSGVLRIGAEVRAAINYPGDHDLLRVSLEAGKSYVFQLLGAGAGGELATSASSFLSLRGATTYASGAQLTVLGGSVEARLAVTPATSGDYFLDVGSEGASGLGSYTVKATLLSGDSSGPLIVAQSHGGGARPAHAGAAPISIAFNEAITIDRTAITLKDSLGQVVVLAYGAGTNGPFASVSDHTLTLTPSTALLPGTYTVTLPQAALHDLAGNRYAGAATITFTTLLPGATGGAGNDLIAGGSGTAIDGGDGRDTVYYNGYDANYAVTRAGASLRVVDLLSGVTDTLVNVERLTMRSWTFAYDLDGDAGQAYRLYQAAFHRTPDTQGVGFWIAQLDQGASLPGVAASFVGSAEFAALYGAAPTDTAYLDALYANVLHRAPDAGGYAFWTNAMHNGGTRADVLMQFSESAENKAALIGVIGDHFAYIAY